MQKFPLYLVKTLKYSKYEMLANYCPMSLEGVNA